MTYNQFIEKVKDEVSCRVESGYTVSLIHVVKNNSKELDGITISAMEGNVAPNIYLNDYYEQYQEGESLEHIIEDILCLYEDKKDCDGLHIDFEYDQLKYKIIYRLVNYERNKPLLETIPHVPFLDLALIFHCLVRNDDTGIGTVRITNEHMEAWETNTEELMRHAIENTPRIFPARIRNMQEVIIDMLELERRDLPENHIDHEDVPMYVLTNSNGINGATTVVYKDLLKEFSESNHMDLFILPSSIHEVILIPYSEDVNRKVLRQMVLDVNIHQVPDEDILSNQVYLYRRETNKIEV